MARRTRIKTRQRNGVTEILCLIDHPMETGGRIDTRTNRAVPAHFIQKLIFEVNGRQVAEADVGTAVAQDPVFIVRVRGIRSGDSIRVRWTDNRGDKGGASTFVT
jgi:sulfur-oxidizing protein SoxZ